VATLYFDKNSMTLWWKWLVPALAGAALTAVGACSDTLPRTTLPDIVKLPEKALTKDEQQGKVNAMIERGQNHQAQAVKQIEQGK
jgi:hypothetical protein